MSDNSCLFLRKIKPIFDERQPQSEIPTTRPAAAALVFPVVLKASSATNPPSRSPARRSRFRRFTVGFALGFSHKFNYAPTLSLSHPLPHDAKSLFGCRTERLPSSHERPFKCIGARARLRFVFVTLKSISRPIASHLALKNASFQLPTS